MNRFALPSALLLCLVAGPAFAAGSTVASDGRIRGAQLESALRQLRERHSAARHASDMQLAEAILAL
jgi:uncharacterized protein (TIGR02448 family)